MTRPRRRGYPRFLLTLAAQVAVASAPGGSAHAAAATSSPSSPAIVLTEGVAYRARLKLSFFQCLASRDRIARKLGGSGFANVQVYTSARDLPADWPAAYRPKAGSCERYAQGIWARATMPRKRPPTIDAWWVAAAR
jgi:hypothetical protein